MNGSLIEQARQGSEQGHFQEITITKNSIPRGAGDRPGKHAKVLVIEDERDMVRLLKYRLQREGYRVHFCYTAEKGLQTIRNIRPDLIILDVMLPGMDGLQLFQIIRREKIMTPVMFLTAKKDVRDQEWGLQLGAEAYVFKPFSLSELMLQVRGITRRKNSSKGHTG